MNDSFGTGTDVVHGGAVLKIDLAIARLPEAARLQVDSQHVIACLTENIDD